MQQPLTSLSLSLEAERAAEHPKVFTGIRVIYRCTGEGLDPDKVRRAIELSHRKYCTVGNMLGKTATITYQMEINGELVP
jgi:putative redox protein